MISAHACMINRRTFGCVYGCKHSNHTSTIDGFFLFKSLITRAKDTSRLYWASTWTWLSRAKEAKEERKTHRIRWNAILSTLWHMWLQISQILEIHSFVYYNEIPPNSKIRFFSFALSFQRKKKELFLAAAHCSLEKLYRQCIMTILDMYTICKHFQCEFRSHHRDRQRRKERAQQIVDERSEYPIEMSCNKWVLEWA